MNELLSGQLHLPGTNEYWGTGNARPRLTEHRIGEVVDPTRFGQMTLEEERRALATEIEPKAIIHSGQLAATPSVELEIN